MTCLGRVRVTVTARRRFTAAYGPNWSKDDTFFSCYGRLHSPQYRETYAADLTKLLPRIALVASTSAGLGTGISAGGSVRAVVTRIASSVWRHCPADSETGRHLGELQQVQHVPRCRTALLQSMLDRRGDVEVVEKGAQCGVPS